MSSPQNRDDLVDFSVRPPVQDYRAANTTRVKRPMYVGLNVLGALLILYAILQYIGVAVIATAMINDHYSAAVQTNTATASDPFSVSAYQSGMMTKAAVIAIPMLIGLIAHALGCALHALRDIARNSWR